MNHRYKKWAYAGVVSVFCMLMIVSSTVTAVSIHSQLNKNIKPCSNQDDANITDIALGFKKIIAVVENTGDDTATITVRFSVSKGSILPVIVGEHEMSIPAGQTVNVPQDFTGLPHVIGGRIGHFSFGAEIETGSSTTFTEGFWFFIFGWEFKK